MTQSTRRALLATAAALATLAIIGALATSYLHVAEVFAPVIPREWPDAKYVAALALDLLALAATLAIVATPSGTPGRRWADVALWTAVLASVAANLRYAWQHVTWGPDILLSGLLPIVAVIGAHMLAMVVAAMAEGETDTAAAPAVVPVTQWQEVAPGEYAPAPKPRRPPAKPAPVAVPADATGKLATDARVAELAGVKPRTARQWRTVGDARYGQALASSGNGQAEPA